MTCIREDNTLLTVGEVAIYLRVDRATVRRWLGTGLLGGIVVGESWRIEQSAVAAFVEECTQRRLSRCVRPMHASVR
jgi:excisionase family DNA binding protein